MPILPASREKAKVKMVVAHGYDPCRSRRSGGSRALIRRARSPEPATPSDFPARPKARQEISTGSEIAIKMERRSGVEPESSDWQTEILTVELPPRIGGPTESRTQRADLARISCTPVPSPKKIDKGEGMAIPSLDLTA
jgi:hypothetical protein